MKFYDVWEKNGETVTNEYEPANLNKDASMERSGWKHQGRLNEDEYKKSLERQERYENSLEHLMAD